MYCGEKIKVRLSAIDCPENGQPWGDKATGALIGMIGGCNVYLEPYGFDSYDRMLATVYVMDEMELVNVNEKMVIHGHAWVMHRFYKHLSRGRQVQLDKKEGWSKKNKKGLWAEGEAIPPWEWRKCD